MLLLIDDFKNIYIWNILHYSNTVHEYIAYSLFCHTIKPFFTHSTGCIFNKYVLTRSVFVQIHNTYIQILAIRVTDKVGQILNINT